MSEKKFDYAENYKNLGLKIQYYRKMRGYTQETFAEAVDISASFVSQIESVATLKGVSLETLFRMAEVLEVEPYQLFKEN
jgi:transcriptional regulator with XRE-family HTH domain